MNELEKIVYDIICSDDQPPSEDEHWEYYAAKRIVAALKPLIAAAEREACASLCKGLAEWHSEVVKAVYENAADAILARGVNE